MPTYANRVAGFGTTIFAEINNLALKYERSIWARAGRTLTDHRKLSKRRCGPCNPAAAINTHRDGAFPSC